MTMVRRIARLRVTIGFVAGVIVLWLAQPTSRSLAVGAAIAAIGEAIRVWAAGHLEKGREVTSTGPYMFTRHPLYLGSSIVGLGFAIASAHLVAGLVVLVYLAVTLMAAIRTEEAHLTEKFGAAYPAYRSGQAVAQPRRFSMARAVRNREYRALVGLLIVLLVLALKVRSTG